MTAWFGSAIALATLGLIAWIYQIVHSGGLYAVYGHPYGWFGADNGYVGEAYQFGLPGALLLLLACSGDRLRLSDLVWIAIGLMPIIGHGLLGARRGPTFLAFVGVGVMWYLVRARRPRLGAALLAASPSACCCCSCSPIETTSIWARKRTSRAPARLRRLRSGPATSSSSAPAPR